MDGDGDRQYDSGTETLFDKFDYTYYLDGSRASETRTNPVGTTTVSWTYDGLNRLLTETFSGKDGQGAALAYIDTYSFDLSSNRTKLVHDDTTSGGGGSAGPDATTTYLYDANDRLLTETKDVVGSATADRHTVYGYGPTDQTSRTVHQGLSASGSVVEDVDFTFDATGRMTGVTITAGLSTTTLSYKYNHDGFRVEMTVRVGLGAPVTTIFHVDPANPTGYIQVVEEGVDADADGRLDASEIAKAFVLGMDVLTQATASAIQHLLYDAHGTTKSILSAATSSVVERYVYSAYGIDLGLASSPLSSLRYAGEYIDPISGLSFNRARWYDPSNGRLNRLDPWTGTDEDPRSLHKYVYAHQSPVTATDPSGLYIRMAPAVPFTLIDVLATIALYVGLAAWLYSANRGARSSAAATATAVSTASIAAALAVETITETEWRRRPRDPGHYYFFHGSSVRRWGTSTALRFGRRSNTDFGRAFYTFGAYTPWGPEPLALQSGFSYAKDRAAQVSQGGDVGFVLITRIPVNEYTALKRLPLDRVGGAVTPLWTQVVTYHRLSTGVLPPDYATYDVVWGPLASPNATPRAPVAISPNQFAFRSLAALQALKPIFLIPVLG